MSGNIHYLRGYLKARSFMRKAAFEDNRSSLDVRKSLADGSKWQPSAQGYIDNTYKNSYNFHKSDPNQRFHSLSPGLSGSAIRNQAALWNERVQAKEREADEAEKKWYSNPISRWLNDKKVEWEEGKAEDWRRNTAREEAARLADDPGMSFTQLLREREKNPSANAVAIRMEVGSDSEDRTNSFRAAVNNYHNEVAEQVKKDPTGTFMDKNLSEQQRRQMRRDAESVTGAQYRYYNPVFGAVHGTDRANATDRGIFYQNEYMRRNHTNIPPNSQQLWDFMNDPKNKQYYGWN